MTDAQNQLRDQCAQIAVQIETGEFDRFCEFCGHDEFEYSDEMGAEICTECKEEIPPHSAMDYLSNALDIQYIVTSNREFLGARVLVAFGGPNIWIDTQKQIVDGAWWNDRATVGYHTDRMGLNDALQELWECY